MNIDIVLLTLRQLLSRGRVLALLGILALTPLLAVVYAVAQPAIAPERYITYLGDGLVLTTVVPLLALVLGAAALGNEAEDGTLMYLLMKPVARWQVAVAKLLPTALIVAALAALTMLLAALIVGRETLTLRAGIAFAAAAAAGGIGYTAAFLYIGLLTSRSLIIGLLYSFLWEGTLTSLFAGLRALSIRQFARGVADALVDLPTTIFRADLSLRGALIGLLLVVVVSYLLVVRRLQTMDVE